MDHTYLLNIERAILSSIIFNPNEIYTISPLLKPEDFFLRAHQLIYQVMLDLQNEDIPIDEHFIINRINKKELNENILVEIISTNPITNVEAYCHEVKEISKVRRIQDLSKKIQVLVSNEDKSDDIIFNLQKEIELIENEIITDAKSSSYLIDEVLSDMKKAAENNNQILGQKSGLKALDNIIGAFEDGDLIIIAARPSMGKTSIISSITIQALSENSGVLIESLEMPAKKIMARLITAHSGENLKDLKKGLIKNKTSFNQSLEFFTNKNLIINDKSYPTLTELQSRIKSTLRKNPNIKNVFIDHTGKIQLQGKTREDIEIGQISAMLKKIARDYNIRVFLLQQLNRSLESRDNKRPLLSDIKNSGNIEEDADIVLGLYRDSYYKSKKASMFTNHIEDAEIIVLKNRDGEVSTANVSFEGRSARFLDRKEADPIIVKFE